MEVITAPYDTTIYIGSGHSSKTKCLSEHTPYYENGLVRFETRQDKFLVLGVKICANCGAIFIPYPKYQKHWVNFNKEYSFIRSKDGKSPSEERIRHYEHKPDTEYVPPKIDYHEQYKTPSYIKYGLNHPNLNL